MYWNDASRDVIASARLDGSDVRSFPSPGGGIGDIVVNPILHKLIWSDAYSQKIYQSNVDGTVLEVLVFSEGFPGSLAIDATARRLYWTDWSADKIFRSDLLGRNIVEVYASAGISSGSGLAFLPEPSSVAGVGVLAVILARRKRERKVGPLEHKSAEILPRQA